MAEWNAARSQSRFGAEVVRHLVAQPVHLRQHEKKLGTDLRGTLQRGSSGGSHAPDLGPFEIVQGATFLRLKKKELVIMLAIRAPRLSRRDFCCGCGSNVLSQSERPRLSRRPAAATALAGRAGTRGTPRTGRRERAACRSISWGIGDPLWCAKASWSHQLSPG